jgi:hypothetical protein
LILQTGEKLEARNITGRLLFATKEDGKLWFSNMQSISTFERFQFNSHALTISTMSKRGERLDDGSMGFVGMFVRVRIFLRACGDVCAPLQRLSQSFTADVITVLDASHVPVANDEAFEELLNNPGLLPLADVENGDICLVLFKAKVLADGKFRVQPVKIIKIGVTPVVLDDEEEFFL